MQFHSFPLLNPPLFQCRSFLPRSTCFLHYFVLSLVAGLIFHSFYDWLFNFQPNYTVFANYYCAIIFLWHYVFNWRYFPWIRALSFTITISVVALVMADFFTSRASASKFDNDESYFPASRIERNTILTL